MVKTIMQVVGGRERPDVALLTRLTALRLRRKVVFRFSSCPNNSRQVHLGLEPCTFESWVRGCEWVNDKLNCPTSLRKRVQ